MELEALSTASGMDSREIAERTGKRHDHVCRDFLEMCSRLGINAPKFGGVYKGGNGETRRCFIIPKRECLILVSGYNIELRAAIIDRWAELEAAAAPRPMSRLDILQMAMEAEKGRLAAEAALDAAKPAIEGMRLLEGAQGTFTLREAAKECKQKPKAFVAWLTAEKILYREKTELRPTQYHLDKGYFTMHVGVAVHKEKSHAFGQTRFTAKGLAWISKKVAKREREENPLIVIDAPG